MRHAWFFRAGMGFVEREASAQMTSAAMSATRASGNLAEGRLFAVWLAIFALVIAGMLVHTSGLAGVFVHDDFIMIVDNPDLAPAPDRTFEQTLRVLFLGRPDAPHASRPVVSATLWLNHYFAGKQPPGFHAFNIAVHLLTALALFGFARRTLLLVDGWRATAVPTAFAIALIWVVHPLPTGAVVYIAQRAESLMGLFFVATFYCLARDAGSEAIRTRWASLAIVSCVLSLASKEVGAMIPLLALLYDRAFVSRSWHDVVANHRRLHLSLVATWVITAGLLMTGPRRESYGWGETSQGVTAWNYATAQCGILLEYVRLVFWPAPLVLDHGWPIPTTFGEYALPGLVLLSLLGLALWTWFKHPRLGFLAAWFFLILGPSSSFVPIPTEIAAEHRMYLPSMALIAIVVLGVQALGNQGMGGRAGPLALKWLTAMFVRAIAAGLLGMATTKRNRAFHDGVALWEDNARRTPENPRAFMSLGYEYERVGRRADALKAFRTAAAVSEISVIPVYPFFQRAVHDGLRLSLALGNHDAAQELMARIHRALAGPLRGSQTLYVDLATALEALGRRPEALAAMERAASEIQDPDSRLYALGLQARMLLDHGRLDAALAVYQSALGLESMLPEAKEIFLSVRTQVAHILVQQRRLDEARRVIAVALGQPASSPEVKAVLDRFKAQKSSLPTPSGPK